jgi:hypothetical protein
MPCAVVAVARAVSVTISNTSAYNHLLMANEFRKFVNAHKRRYSRRRRRVAIAVPFLRGLLSILQTRVQEETEQ